MPNKQPHKLLTIAGSDSGGAAGLQADLKTWTVLGAYGMSVVTAVTAQNSVSVNGVQFMSPDFVAAQMDAVLSDYGATAVKTGFLGKVDIIKTVAAKIHQYRPQFVIIDPVLVNHRGETMFPPDVTDAYVNYLLPLATLVTPNRHEAALLPSDLPYPILVKSVIDGDQLIDRLSFSGQQTHQWTSPRIDTNNTHGSGDTLSAAICFYLAEGHELATAVAHARAFTHKAIQRGSNWQLGAGHGPVGAVKPK